MRKKGSHGIGVVLAVVLMAQVIGEPLKVPDLHMVQAAEADADESAEMDAATDAHGELAENGVIVTTRDEFMKALSQQNVITVKGTITIGEEVDSTGKMIPVKIPGGTTIQGTEGASLNCRCPIQLLGDNVTIKNIELTFDSSDAAGSVPHREIFLAGHSLILDNVETYLAGGGGSLGGLGSSEAELLPSVYAGGFENTEVGKNAALIIQNATSKTMFKEIYMSHDAKEDVVADTKVPYYGTAVLKLSPKTIVREGIYTNRNSSAEIEIAQAGNVSDVTFYGNDKTVLTVRQASVYADNLTDVGTLVLKENAQFELKQGSLGNVILQQGACLDLNLMTDVVVTGDFTGGEYDVDTDIDERGILVLNKEGTLDIQGTVSQSTIFQTRNKHFPGEYISEKKYITAAKTTNANAGFVLPDSKTEEYELRYETDGWSIYQLSVDDLYPSVDSIDICSAPKAVEISKIKSTDFLPAKEAPYCEIDWKDEKGNKIDTEMVEMLGFCNNVICIKTEYWQSKDALEQTDWGGGIQFMTSEEHPDRYYFYADKSDQIHAGDYTFLFCSESYEEPLYTVADVKALKTIIKAELRVPFYNVGDVNLDNKEDSRDLVRILRHIQLQEDILTGAADIDGDLDVDADDASAMRKLLLDIE